MSVKKLPYYPLYVDDFDDDEHVLPMTLAEVGLYQLALNEAWKRGSIPDDPKALSLAIRRDLREVKKSWPRIRPRFVENGTPGRLVNPRQEKERLKAIEKSDKAANAGRLSHGRSANAKQTHRAGSAEAELRASESKSSSTVETSKNSSALFDDGFHSFQEAYLATGAIAIDTDWSKARAVWNQLDMAQKLSATKHVATIDPAYMKLPVNYIADHEWDRKPRPAPKSRAERMLDAI